MVGLATGGLGGGVGLCKPAINSDHIKLNVRFTRGDIQKDKL